MRLPWAVLAATFSCSAFGQSYTISTFAGGAPPPTPIAATQAAIASSVGPSGIAVDPAGNVYFSAENCVFKIDASGVMTRVVGNSRTGYSGDGGAATNAQLNYSYGVAVSASGDLYVADQYNNSIRKVSASGIITTVAGIGSYELGYSGDGGPAISARLSYPNGVALDGNGNLYIADSLNNRIRKVSASGIITTVAGGGANGLGDGGPATSAQLNRPFGVAVDASGNIYIADTDNNRIREVSVAGVISTVVGVGLGGYSGDGGPATSAQLHGPLGLALDGSGNLYIADAANDRIREVSSTGIITTVAGIGYVSSGDSGDGGPATSAVLSQPAGVAVDASGNLYVAEFSNRVRKVSAAGTIMTIAGNGYNSYSASGGYSGDGGPASSAQLNEPWGAVADASGNLYIADYGNNRVRKVSTAGMITTVAGTDSLGYLAGAYSGDGGPAISAQLSGPSGLALDASGNLYVADRSNYRVRKISTSGIISTVAGDGPSGSPGALGDGGPATSASLNQPSGVALDSNGNIFIADSSNARVRKVSMSGIITTVAGGGSVDPGDGGLATNAQLSNPAGVAVDASDNLYIADIGSRSVREVSSATGIITTIAGTGSAGSSGDGGPATSAGLVYPSGVTLDANGNLYIADFGAGRIRKISTAGIITTIAGNGGDGFYSGDGGPAVLASFSAPESVALDHAGNVYISDVLNNAVRILTPSASACTFSVTPTSLQVPASGGNLTVSIQTSASCAWTISGLPSWIAVSGSASGTGPATITLIVTPNSGAPLSTTISIAGVSVTVNQASSVLSVKTGGVVNAASFTGPIAPGSIAAIFGNFLLPAPVSAVLLPIPGNLGGLSLQFTGASLAPLFYANTGQANAQIPWELTGQSQTTITATISGQTSAPQTVSLAIYAPGIFTANGEGIGQGAVLDVNNQLIASGNPTTAGAVIQIYCTGLGPVTNRPATGAASPVSPLSQTTTTPKVVIGGVPAFVQFAGLTPTEVGVYQVNVVVPQGSPTGLSVPVTISIGGAMSNTVTIAVD
jgi:uncharacterized protein (TIGR03437 family)